MGEGDTTEADDVSPQRGNIKSLYFKNNNIPYKQFIEDFSLS